ncbi:hypothetical protein ASE14_12265 [Agromyces sp. Root81]|uniref:hypothetical protein n=1 Tax=Agromyces sp. Root81 TaxID=1736601 RepID=UPI0006F854DE|nr:hypothetical protein [Agromyces sp. Root81]KRC61609.1 hypothetical protein ASE14_12265 [Agromyces sp. Root81]
MLDLACRVDAQGVGEAAQPFDLGDDRDQFAVVRRRQRRLHARGIEEVADTIGDLCDEGCEAALHVFDTRGNH